MNQQTKHRPWDSTGAPMTVDNSDMHIVLLMKKGISAMEAVARMKEPQTGLATSCITRNAINKMMEK